MRLKNDFVEDQLNREKTAVDYVNFINILKGNHTIALDAPWGSGKTTFIDFMTTELDKNKDLYIIYNAWENDYTDDPFLSLISTFFSQVKENGYIQEEELQGIINTALAISKVLFKGVVKGAGKAIMVNEAVENLSDNLEEIIKGTVNEATNKIANKVFKDINLSKKTREQFTIKLKETTSKIVKENNKEKLIIIIDELDRCKPTFAINLLENIKHLFSIYEIVFFIATDRKQLAESIKAVYGSGFDATTYLDRFFDINLHLSNKSLNNYINSKYQSLFDSNESSRVFSNTDMDKIISTLNLTVRDIEKILYETLLLKTITQTTKFVPEACIMLLILKYKIPNFYQKFIFEEDYKIQEFMINNNLSKSKNDYVHEPIERLILIPTIVDELQNYEEKKYSLRFNIRETINSIESKLEN